MTDDRMTLDEDTLLRFRHGALSPADAERVARQLAEDAGARALLAEWDRQDATLGLLFDPVAAEPLPDALRQRLRAAERQTAAPLGRGMRQLAAALVLLAAGGAIGWGAARWQAPDPGTEAFADAALRAYATYTVEVVHPVEVAGTDTAHLSTWMTKRLGHKITPPDLAAEGLTLLGGRILPDASGVAALLMYEDGSGRRITLFVLPTAEGSDTPLRFAAQDGTNSFFWIDGNLSCAITGELPRETLRAIARAAYDQLA